MIYRTARKDGHLFKKLMKKKETLKPTESGELLDFDLCGLLEVIGSHIYAGIELELIDISVYERLIALLQQYVDKEMRQAHKDAIVH